MSFPLAKFLLSRNKEEALIYEKDIEKRIMSEVYVKQIRMLEFFQDFDPLRKGTVTEDKVIRFIFSCLHVSTLVPYRSFQIKYASPWRWYQRARQPIHKFRRVTNLGTIPTDLFSSLPFRLIKYKEFCENINQQFFDYDLALDNLRKTKSQAIYSEDEARIVETALQHIQQEIKNRRILIKQSFLDFDRTRSSHVTTTQVRFFFPPNVSIGFILSTRVVRTSSHQTWHCFGRSRHWTCGT